MANVHKTSGYTVSFNPVLLDLTLYGINGDSLRFYYGGSNKEGIVTSLNQNSITFKVAGCSWENYPVNLKAIYSLV